MNNSNKIRNVHETHQLFFQFKGVALLQDFNLNEICSKKKTMRPSSTVRTTATTFSTTASTTTATTITTNDVYLQAPLHKTDDAPALCFINASDGTSVHTRDRFWQASSAKRI